MKVGSPPQSSVILEKGGGKGNAILWGYWEELAVLVHLENPSFQGFSFLTTEGRGAIWFDVDYMSHHWSSLSSWFRDCIQLFLLLTQLFLELSDLLEEAMHLNLHGIRLGLGLVFHLVVLGWILVRDRAPKVRSCVEVC